MRKSLLLATFAAAAVSAGAQTNDAPVGKWGALLHAGNQTQNSAVVCDESGAYWLNDAGTTEDADWVKYNETLLFNGEKYNSGSSYTHNLCVLHTTPEGKETLLAYSTAGDCSSNSGNLVLDNEGNLIFSMKMRQGDFASEEAITIIDGTGKTYTIGAPTERRSYGLLLVKATKAGEFQWYKFLTLDTTPSENATKDFIADAVNSTALTVDDEGNIYLGGNYSAEMTVTDEVKLPARNIATWTGDSQVASGDAFIIKYDKNGNYLASVIGNDGLTRSQIQSLDWVKGQLYFYGNAQGSTNFEFCGETIPVSTLMTPVYGCLNADLTAVWSNHFDVADVSGACVIQNSSMTFTEDNIWFTGMYNGKFINPENAEEYVASAGKTPREGCLIKLDANGGKWIKGVSSRASDFTPASAKTGLTGYFKALINPEKPQKVYVFGYVMNATVGVFLREYNAETLEANVEHAWSLMTGGGSPSCTAIAHEPVSNLAYFAGRGMGNQTMTLIGGEYTTVKPTKQSNLLGCVVMPADLMSGVAAPELEATENTAAEYFNLQGMRVNADRLTPGIYIVRQGGKTSKTLVK